LETQARRSMEAGRDDLARIALERRLDALRESEDLGRQAAEVSQEEQRLTASEQSLSMQIDQFQARRHVMVARYSAAEAHLRVKEALAGVSGDVAELGMAVGRAAEKTERMQARASALSTLLTSNALAWPAVNGDDIERQLSMTSAASTIESQLASIRSELARPQTGKPRAALPQDEVGTDA